MVLPLSGGKSLCPHLPSCELGISQAHARWGHRGSTVPRAPGLQRPCGWLCASSGPSQCSPSAQLGPGPPNQGSLPNSPAWLPRPGASCPHDASWGAGAHLPRACPAGQPPMAASRSLRLSAAQSTCRPHPAASFQRSDVPCSEGPAGTLPSCAGPGTAFASLLGVVALSSPASLQPRPPISPHRLMLPADPERLLTLLQFPAYIRVTGPKPLIPTSFWADSAFAEALHPAPRSCLLP